MGIYITVVRRDDLPEDCDDPFDAYGVYAAAAADYFGVERDPADLSEGNLPWSDELTYQLAEGDWSDLYDYGLWAFSIPAAAHVIVSLLDRIKAGVIVSIRDDDVVVSRERALPRGSVLIVNTKEHEVRLEQPSAQTLVTAIKELGGNASKPRW